MAEGSLLITARNRTRAPPRQARYHRSARGRPVGADSGRAAAPAAAVHAPAGLWNRGRVVPVATHHQVGDEVDTASWVPPPVPRRSPGPGNLGSWAS